jgi:WD40 repeat protein/tRNA A-37 threonylcarbamoyl transferase component Bud32
MNSERQLRVRELFAEAQALPEDARAEFLEGACEGDAGLCAEVESMLAAAQATRGLLDRPEATRPGERSDRPLGPGTRLGPWSVERLIGRGGMGEVYEARRADGAFELRIAIKLLKRGLDTDAVVARFGRERRILAQLDHPNIAHVLDAGVAADGRPFLAMEYVEGSAITEYARTHGLSTAGVLRLMITACEAAQAAHAKRIVHRDLKPSNVMVSSQGQVKLLDFGIAKALSEEDDDATRLAGEATVLTPSYAAPEQLLGRPATPASDVYALGVILYQMLVERLPHRRAGLSSSRIALELDRETRERLSSVLRRERGRLPEQQRIERLHAVSKDLDLIVLKALHAEAGHRYPSGQELADDLRRLMESRPVLARPDSIAYRAGRFVRRNRRGLLQLGGAGSIAALIAAAALIHQARMEHLRRLVALGQEQLSTQHAARAAAYLSAAYSLGDRSADVRFGLARAMPAVEAMMAWSVGYPGAEYQGVSYSPDSASVVLTDLGKRKPFATVWDVNKQSLKHWLEGAPALAQTLYSRDSSRVLLAGTPIYMQSGQLTQVWDLRTGAKLFEAAGSTGPGDNGPCPVFIAADPDLSRVLSISPEGKAQLWDVSTGQKLFTLDTPGKALSAAFSRDGSRIVTGTDDGMAAIWDAAAGTVKNVIHITPATPATAFFANKDKFVVTASRSGVLHLWDADTGMWLGSPGGADGPLLFAGLDTDGRRLVTLAGGQGNFKVWDLITQELVPHSFTTSIDYFGGFRLQPGGDGIVTPATDGVRVWSHFGEDLSGLLEANSEESSAVAYSPDGNRILTAAEKGLVRMWDARALHGEPVLSLPHEHVAQNEQYGPWWARYTPDGKRIVSGGTDSTVRIWNAEDGKLLAVLHGHKGPVFISSISPDGRLLVTGSEDHTARIWDLQSGETLAVLEGHTDRVAPLISPDGESVITYTGTEPAHSARIWDIHSGKLLGTLQGDAPRFIRMQFSPDSRRVVTSHADAAARIWDAHTGRLLLTLGCAGAVWSAAFSPDGSHVLTVSENKAVQLWDAADGRLLRQLDHLDFQPRIGIFNRAGDIVAIGGGTAVFLWEPATGRRTVLPSGGGAKLSFSPDESLLVGASSNNRVNIWSVSSGTLLASWTNSRQPNNPSPAFSPDGQRLVTAGISPIGESAYVWDVSEESRSPEQIAAIVA